MNVKQVALWLTMIMVVSFIIAGVTMGPLAFVPGYFEGAGETYRDEQFFSVKDLQEIVIDTTSSEITIKSQDDTADIKVVVEATGFSSAAMPIFKVAMAGNTLNISVKHKPGIGLNMGTREKIEVYVPAEYRQNLTLNNTSGNTHIKGLNLNTFIYHAVSGDLQATEILTKQAQVESVSGDIQLKGFAGDIKAGNISGDIKIAYGTYQDNKITLENTSGDIQLRLPSHAGFKLKASSVSGRIHSDFPVSVTTNSNRHLQGQVGQGEGQIMLESVSGNIDINK